MSEGSSRLAPLTGVIAVAALVASFLVGGETPDFDASGQEVISFYVEDESAQIASSILAAYGALAFVFFAGALRAALRRDEEAAGGLSAVAFGGALLMAVGIAIFAGLGFTLADTADALDPAAAQALNALNGDLFFPLAIGTAALLLASGIAITRGAALPRWLGWVAILLGIVAITPIGFVAFIASGAWILIVSIVLARRAAAA